MNVRWDAQRDAYTVTMTGGGRLFACATPYDPSPQGILDAPASGGEATHVVPSPLPGHRVYFALADAQGAPGVWVGDRGVEIRSIENFRDMGGYPAADGRRVRWGRFFRCGAVMGMSPAEQATFASMGIAHVLDYRAAFETQAKPDQVPAPAIHHSLPAIREQGEMAKLASLDFSQHVRSVQTQAQADEGFALFASLYRLLPFDNPAYGQMFALLDEEGGVPLIQHCSAGKDRTGVGCALLLAALGVPREIILADYLLSNEYRAEASRAFFDKVAKAGLSEAASSMFVRILSVEPSLIEGTFAAIDARYGTVEGYLRQEHGVDAARLDRWRAVHTV